MVIRIAVAAILALLCVDAESASLAVRNCSGGPADIFGFNDNDTVFLVGPSICSAPGTRPTRP